MKKLLFSLSLLASLATFAGESSVDATAQVFGCLPVTAKTKSVIVSVPWLAAGSGTASDIAVADIIKTAGLTAGDTLKVWKDNKYYVWTLTKGSDDVLYWAKGSTVTVSGVTPGADSDVTTVARGDALLLTRADGYTAGTEYTFYVYGQYTSAASSTYTIAAGTEDTPAYTLIAPPYATATNLNAGNWTGLNYGGADKGCDRIYVIEDAASASGMKFAYYNSTEESWGRRGGSIWNSNVSIPAGRGCWYVSWGTNKTVTVTWPAAN